MFTVETDFDDTTIIVIDDSGQEEDLAVILFDDVVYLRQYIEGSDKAQVISITPDMYRELMEAWNKPDGMYRTVRSTDGV